MKSAALTRFRDEQKALAARIAEQRTKFRQSQRAGDPIYSLDRGARHDSHDYRYRHIAYCMARGKSIEQIESKHRRNNEPNMTIVDGILKKLHAEMAAEQIQEPVAAATE